MTIRKILVAVDGSEASINASNHAIEMAKKFDASLIVLCIVSPSAYMDLGYANVGRMKEIESTEKKQAQQEVDKVKKKAMEKEVTVKSNVLVKYTSIVKEIVEYAKKHKIDLIVTGSRGVTGFKKMLLGSVASGVITYAHCPVLVVK
ncbi:MAG TPA: universal stress protein [Nitrososphaeraceae archaeon]|nr:universal stress protein [Nitrososphaeraceae archaeon]